MSASSGPSSGPFPGPSRPGEAPLLRQPPARATHPLPGVETGGDTLDTPFELGRDHARHGLTPPLELLCLHQRLQQGFRAGRAVFGRHTRAADRRVQAWLALRLQALRERLAFESVQLTPHFLAQLDVAHCPVTREPLGDTPGTPNQRRFVRLRPDAGYAAGHLVVASARAVEARGELGRSGALQRQRACEEDGRAIDGLDAAQWARWAALCALVEPMEHARAAALPLAVLPPNRLRLFNPVQALQALASRALVHRTPNRRLAALHALLPAQALGPFEAWLRAYRARFEALAAGPGLRPAWALEDAWADREVLSRWRRLAARLDAASCERIALELGGAGVRWLPEAAATEGWALDRGGRRPAGRPLPSTAPRRRVQLGLFDRAA